MQAVGSSIVSENEVLLQAWNLPQYEFGFFLMSDSRASTPIGNGILCLGGSIVRLLLGPDAVQNSGPAGAIQRSLDLMALDQGVVVLPGSTWRYQLWHRDFDSVMVMPSMNFSEGLEVTFE